MPHNYFGEVPKNKTQWVNHCQTLKKSKHLVALKLFCCCLHFVVLCSMNEGLEYAASVVASSVCYSRIQTSGFIV
uniref:Uncharacterized protein n=1 Tax=Anguilla anguilla TaxID=7936 RepID=A0A0E9WS45_ANGAN